MRDSIRLTARTYTLVRDSMRLSARTCTLVRGSIRLSARTYTLARDSMRLSARTYTLMRDSMRLTAMDCTAEGKAIKAKPCMESATCCGMASRLCRVWNQGEALYGIRSLLRQNPPKVV